MTMELRFLHRDGEEVLQYRRRYPEECGEVTDWFDVPHYKEVRSIGRLQDEEVIITNWRRME